MKLVLHIEFVLGEGCENYSVCNHTRAGPDLSLLDDSLLHIKPSTCLRVPVDIGRLLQTRLADLRNILNGICKHPVVVK
jgi:hypothetical protein